MKIPILSQPLKQLAALTLAATSVSSLPAASYSVFRVCQDQHVIRTSDGAEAGNVEYIVVDPAEQRVVSTVITGGVLGERHIAVPYSDVQISGEREIVLTNITRERIVSAPTIEVSRFTSSSVLEPSVVEQSTTYFSGDRTVDTERSSTTRVDSAASAPPENRSSATVGESAPNASFDSTRSSREETRRVDQDKSSSERNRASTRQNNRDNPNRPSAKNDDDRPNRDEASTNGRHHRASAETANAAASNPAAASKSTPSPADRDKPAASASESSRQRQKPSDPANRPSSAASESAAPSSRSSENSGASSRKPSSAPPRSSLETGSAPAGNDASRTRSRSEQSASTPSRRPSEAAAGANPQ